MTLGVRWLSVGPGSGVGDASEAYMRGLRDADVPVTWTPLGWPSLVWKSDYGPLEDLDRVDSEHRDIALASLEHDTVVVHSTPLWHEQLEREAKGKQLVAYTTWETNCLRDEDVTILNRYDQVLVPSTFNAEAFASSGVESTISVVPHIVWQPPPQSGSAGAGAVATKFVFYLIATWTTRKAILDTVEAFCRAFSSSDDVALVIHTTPEDLIARARNRSPALSATRPNETSWFALANALGGRHSVPEIILSTRRFSRSQIERLHERGDCFVSLSRGEGWGLGAFDAAAFANPVVVTGWGGSLDFLPKDYPYLVEFDLIETDSEDADVWWEPRRGERWAKVRIDHAAQLLRQVYENRDEGRTWGRALQENVLSNYDIGLVTDRLVAALAAGSGA